jgi:phosphatidylglycerophosphate synthase
MTPLARRELATRNRSWARAVAAWLVAHRVRPNVVSVASVVAAAGAAAAFVSGWPVLAAAAIQLRLLCNMLDGMLAVEGGLKTKTGDIFNELPDRLADVLILVGAGYALRDLPNGPVLGWLAAVLALMTAYVRVLSGSLGLPQHFLGPMAKQHRMFALTLGALGAAVEASLAQPARALPLALAIIVVGSAITTWRRVTRLLRDANGPRSQPS